MEQTDFGQIEIFDNLFSDIDKSTIKYTPSQCIENKKTYSALYKQREIPIMIGSSFSHKNDNPLGINGYFIIDGICYSMNNIYIKIKNNFTKDSCFLVDGSRIRIKNMFDYERIHKGKIHRWYIPTNWDEIDVKGSEVYKFLENVSKFSKCKDELYNNINRDTLKYMFRCWLGLIDEPDYNFRLITPGELIHDSFINKKDIIACFRLSKWDVKYMLNVTTVSEQMKHYNILSDIESIRKITYPTIRENMILKDRQVKFFERNKICPIQSPDGQLCGTVKFLADGARVTTKKFTPTEWLLGEIRVFWEGKYFDSVSERFLESLKDCDIIRFDNFAYISSNIGRIISSKLILSVSGNKIPYVLHNPPVRATFTTSMLKQSIEYSKQYINIIDNVKYLNNDINKKFNVAIMTWFGYNIEDSIIISSEVASAFNYSKQYIYRESVKILDIKVKVGDLVKKDQLLYKTYNPKEIKTLTNVNSKSKGEVVYLSHSPFKIVIIEKKDLQVGDKMTSLHGQKGVISLILKNSERPYYIESDKKIFIDIIINPHAFPSRMTLGQIKEMKENYKTVYVNEKEIKNKILVGKCTYLALRHQVDDKIQYCNNNSFNNITKQTLDGKRNNGGLRFGQMERDILVAIEAYETLKELWSIDKTKIPWCEKSGLFYPKCCNKLIDTHQFFVICLSLIRCLGKDILLNKNGNYSIIDLNINNIEKSNNKYFGIESPSEIRVYKNLVIPPFCLRSNKLNRLLNEDKLNEKLIKKEIKKSLCSKEGAFHKYFEGHKSIHCFRSVISPDPNLPLDVVKIPIGINIGTEYCILNRQPTLNISSMKLMKIEYKLEKTISFNPLLCKSFNADFDGDEMNLYGIKNENSIKELDRLPKDTDNTQDYILLNKLNLKSLAELTYYGITFSRADLELMIKYKSKGEIFNYKYMFEKIDKVRYGNKDYIINSNYYDGLTTDEWYILSMITRNNTASIALNTPISGYIQSLANQLII